MPDRATPPPPAWHAQPTDEVQRQLQAHTGGLSDAEVQRRLAQHGPNRLAPPKRRGPLLRFLLQFHNILLYVMLGAALITAALGHWVDTGVLLAAVLVNAIIGFIQEGKAESALEAIRSMLSPHATVLRDGQRRDIDAAELVPGDRVLLASGDRVPADLRLVEVRELRVDEAALTGESLPVDKDTQPVAADAALGDRSGMAYSGTLVVYGQAAGVVVATGSRTELGQINRMLAGIRNLSTPLLRQIDRFGRVLALGILVLCAATFVLGVLWRGHPASEMFMMVVALAASAIPEGLPAIMTVTLALGVQRMAKRQAIVRRLPAVEALGAVTVICSDKTGTLTRNEMTVQRVVCTGLDVDVSGVGYEPVGEFSIGGRAIDTERHPALALALRAGVLCNDAQLHEEQGRWLVVGDPTEGALLVAGQKAGFTPHVGSAEWPRLDSIPFESQHRFMATWHRDADGQPWIFVKGAPERLLDICALERGDGGDRALDVDTWRRMATDTAAKGLRLLALACKRAAPLGERLGFADIEHGFTMLGLVGIVDPPRDEAIRAVADCHAAGIRVKMITGDHAETAKAIGAQLAIGVGKPALTGAEVALMDDAALRRVAMEVDVFARASPEHKLRLVQALQDDGQVVAMTGDGVNDAPALKRADGEAVHMHVLDPIAQAINDEAAHNGVVGVDGVADAAGVDEAGAVGGVEHVIGVVGEAAHRERRPVVAILGRVVVHDIEDDLDIGAVQGLDHIAEFIHRPQHVTAGAVWAVWREEGDGLIAPVVGQRRGGGVGVELMDRQQFDGLDAERLEIGDLLDQAGIGAAQVIRQARIGVRREAFDVHLVDDRVAEAVMQRLVAFPVVGVGIHDDRAHSGRDRIVAEPAGRAPVVDIFLVVNGPRIRVEQRLAAVVAFAAWRVVGTVGTIGVALAGAQARDEDMPVVESLVAVTVERDRALRQCVVGGRKQQQINAFRAISVNAEIDAAALNSGPKRKRVTRLDGN